MNYFEVVEKPKLSERSQDPWKRIPFLAKYYNFFRDSISRGASTSTRATDTPKNLIVGSSSLSCSSSRPRASQASGTFAPVSAALRAVGTIWASKRSPVAPFRTRTINVRAIFSEKSSTTSLPNARVSRPNISFDSKTPCLPWMPR